MAREEMLTPKVKFEVGANVPPSYSDLAFASIDIRGGSGFLNRLVMDAYQYSEFELPKKGELTEGYSLLTDKRRSPIVFVVTVDYKNTAEALSRNLEKAILANSEFLKGKKAWLPLMGTGKGGLGYMESYNVIVSVLNKLYGKLKETIFLFSVPKGPEANGVYEHLKTIPTVPFNNVGSILNNESSDDQPDKTEGLSSSSAEPNEPRRPVKHWILKLRPERLTSREPGWVFPYSTYRNNEKRSDYERFKQLKLGDRVLGYDYVSAKNIFCVFEVTKEIHKEGAEESVTLTLAEIMNDLVLVDFFKDESPTVWKELETPSLRLVPIDALNYNRIIIGLRPVPPPGRKQLNPYFITEGNHRETEDKLKFQDDIDSLSTVISLKSVDPPLAIGLFGNWGSGKSFFMQKLERRIDELKGSGPDFVKTVVHVKFNSWHYSDTNLWACLIAELFDALNQAFRGEKEQNELRRLTNTLQVSSAQAAAAEEKTKDLKGKIEKLTDDQAEKRKRLGDLSGFKLLKLVLSDKKVQEDLGGLKNEHLEKIMANKDELKSYIDEVKNTRENIWKGWSIIKSLKGWRWVVVLGIAAVIFVLLSYVLPKFLSVQWNDLTRTISTIVALAIPALGNLLKVARGLTKTYTRLDSLYNTIDGRPTETSPQLQKDIADLEGLSASLTDLKKKIQDTRTEINDILSGRKLMEFIDQRVKDDGYARQLGLISWIRRDFSKLDELLRKQHQLTPEERDKVFNPENVTLQIDRIILYIDDLDRCKEDIVVKVLEAVHLLLAFPLFVVIVGVDPRWLNNALDEKYKTLLGGPKSNGHHPKKNEVKSGKKQVQPAGAEEREPTEEELLLAGAATTYDYLEKIFQIPFTLKPIQPTGRKDLLEYLTRKEMRSDPSVKPVSIPGQQNAPAISGTPAPQPSPPAGSIVASPQPAQPPLPTPAQPPPPPAPVAKEKLEFITGELKYMQDISELFGHTPRSINRYVNIYRIIKSHNSFEVKDTFSEDDYMPVMVVLSIVVGYSVLAQELIDAIKVKDKDLAMSNFLDDQKISVKLKDLLTRCIGSKALSMRLELYQRNLELVSRFSFRTIRYEDEVSID